MVALHKQWKNDIASEVRVFGWRLLLEKLPTRAALSSKGILSIPHDLQCIFFCFHKLWRTVIAFSLVDDSTCIRQSVGQQSVRH
jgi:hypothetical protein